MGGIVSSGALIPAYSVTLPVSLLNHVIKVTAPYLLENGWGSLSSSTSPNQV